MSDSKASQGLASQGFMVPVHTLHSTYGVVQDVQSLQQGMQGLQSGQGGQDLSADLDASYTTYAAGVLADAFPTEHRDDRSSRQNASATSAAEYQAGRRMFAEPRLLGVLVPDELKVRIKAGTGPGRHAFHKEFKGDPFPLKRGAVVNFDLRFERGFEWGCRGKIGGLFIGHGEADGGEHSKYGASLRLMWDAGGGAYAYVYVPKGSERHQPSPLDEHNQKGTSVFKNAYKRSLVGTNWHRIQLGVKLNSFTKNKPNADGELLLSIDDKQRILRNVMWRLRDDISVEQFALGVFHGGPCRATRTSATAVRDVRVYSW